MRDVLWSDGLGNRKRHNVKWEWCCTPRKQGGLGTKDLKKQGRALISKWLIKAIEGNEPWKVLIRNNVVRSVIKQEKNWGNIPFLDILLGDFEIKVFGSRVFFALWKAWKDIKPLLCFRSAIGRNPFFAITDRSLW